jgi:hypothetical protein
MLRLFQPAPQAKLSLFSSIDAPLPPSSRGLSLFTNGLSDQSRQLFRDGAWAAYAPPPAPSTSSRVCARAGLLAAERRDVAAACAQLLSGGIVCAAGPEERCVRVCVCVCVRVCVRVCVVLR